MLHKGKYLVLEFEVYSDEPPEAWNVLPDDIEDFADNALYFWEEYKNLQEALKEVRRRNNATLREWSVHGGNQWSLPFRIAAAEDFLELTVPKHGGAACATQNHVEITPVDFAKPLAGRADDERHAGYSDDPWTNTIASLCVGDEEIKSFYVSCLERDRMPLAMEKLLKRLQAKLASQTRWDDLKNALENQITAETSLAMRTGQSDCPPYVKKVLGAKEVG